MSTITQEKVLVTVDRFIGIPLQQKAEKVPRACRVTRKELKNTTYDIPERCDGFSSQTIPLLQVKKVLTKINGKRYRTVPTCELNTHNRRKHERQKTESHH